VIHQIDITFVSNYMVFLRKIRELRKLIIELILLTIIIVLHVYLL